MPFIAVDAAHNTKVIAFDYDSTADLKTEFPRGFRCTCGRTMHPRGGLNQDVILHFAHNPHKGGGEPPECSVEEKYKGMRRVDLVRHNLGQRAVYRYLKANALNEGESVEIEVPIGNRRADICIKSPDGTPLVAHEIQFSRQSIPQLVQRSMDYEKCGVEVIWWFGAECDTPETQAWAKSNFCYHNRILIGNAVNISSLSYCETIVHTEQNDSYNIDQVCNRNDLNQG